MSHQEVEAALGKTGIFPLRECKHSFLIRATVLYLYAKLMHTMKNFRFLFLALFMALGTHAAWADIANEDEVGIKIELMNGAKFPGFEFYIRYQSYTYNMGYQPTELSDIVLEAGKPTATGQRGDRSLLYARDSKGREFVSKKEVGGVVTDRGVNVAYYLDQIVVTSLKKGEIKFKTVRKIIGTNDEVLEIIKGDVGVGGGGKSNWMIAILPLLSLAGLVAFFILRRKTGRKSSAA